MAVFLQKRDDLYVEVGAQSDARIIFSVSINGREILKTSTRNPATARWSPKKSDGSASVAWTFAIDTPKAKYELTIRHVSPDADDPTKGELLHRATGTSSDHGAHQSIGNLVVFYPAAEETGT
jgi:hypothetical protein